jgi:anti-anti-sigma factor
MNLTTDRAQGVAIVRIGETRMMYPLLADFSGAVMGLLTSGDKKVMIDLSKVTYVDSATIGCLMDLYRQATAAGGQLRLAGVNKRVETMLTMTGAHNFLKMFPDEAGALQSFGSGPCAVSRPRPARKSFSTATCSPCSRRSITRSRRARSWNDPSRT